MPQPTNKAEWIKLLHLHGEEVPSEWTVAQIKARWSEMQAMREILPEEKLKKQMAALNKAAEKKANLIGFLQNLGLEINGNHTIDTLVSLGTQRILQDYEPTAQEHVGFGKHGALTYQELWEEHQSYVPWVLQTDVENQDANWRLKRLARWLRQRQSHSALTMSKPATKAMAKSPTSQSSFSLVEAHSEGQGLASKYQEVDRLRQELQNRLAEVEAQAKELEAEKADLESEKTHKTRKEM